MKQIKLFAFNLILSVNMFTRPMEKEEIKLLLKFLNNDKSGRADSENLLLIYIEQGNIHRVETLINEGVNVNCKSFLGFTPLKLAREKKNQAIIDLLIKSGAKE